MVALISLPIPQYVSLLSIQCISFSPCYLIIPQFMLFACLQFLHFTEFSFLKPSSSSISKFSLLSLSPHFLRASTLQVSKADYIPLFSSCFLYVSIMFPSKLKVLCSQRPFFFFFFYDYSEILGIEQALNNKRLSHVKMQTKILRHFSVLITIFDEIKLYSL